MIGVMASELDIRAALKHVLDRVVVWRLQGGVRGKSL